MAEGDVTLSYEQYQDAVDLTRGMSAALENGQPVPDGLGAAFQSFYAQNNQAEINSDLQFSATSTTAHASSAGGVLTGGVDSLWYETSGGRVVIDFENNAYTSPGEALDVLDGQTYDNGGRVGGLDEEYAAMANRQPPLDFNNLSDADIRWIMENCPYFATLAMMAPEPGGQTLHTATAQTLGVTEGISAAEVPPLYETDVTAQTVSQEPEAEATEQPAQPSVTPLTFRMLDETGDYPFDNPDHAERLENDPAYAAQFAQAGALANAFREHLQLGEPAVVGSDTLNAILAHEGMAATIPAENTPESRIAFEYDAAGNITGAILAINGQETLVRLTIPEDNAVIDQYLEEAFPGRNLSLDAVQAAVSNAIVWEGVGATLSAPEATIEPVLDETAGTGGDPDATTGDDSTIEDPAIAPEGTPGFTPEVNVTPTVPPEPEAATAAQQEATYAALMELEGMTATTAYTLTNMGVTAEDVTPYMDYPGMNYDTAAMLFSMGITPDEIRQLDETDRALGGSGESLKWVLAATTPEERYSELIAAYDRVHAGYQAHMDARGVDGAFIAHIGQDIARDMGTTLSLQTQASLDGQPDFMVASTELRGVFESLRMDQFEHIPDGDMSYLHPLETPSVGITQQQGITV